MSDFGDCRKKRIAIFANKRGLDQHIGHNKNNNCGRLAYITKRTTEIAKRRLQKQGIFNLKMKNVGPKLNPPNK